VGGWRFDGGPVSADELDPMMRAISHRGPDDGGVWLADGVGFGHCRLSIIDLSSAGHQPMLTTDGRGVLAYNGEVYNFRELRTELEREGVSVSGGSDTEVVLAALHAWGPERSVLRFNGMFAFAYFDARESVLWLARDRLGIKPLYTAEIGGRLLFGSEVKALKAHPHVAGAIDISALHHRFLAPPTPHDTLFKDVHGLPPGCLWKVTRSGVRKQRYFEVETSIDAERLADAHRRRDRQAVVATFRDTIRASVRIHLASDVPIAAMCSGGVDSSLIAAFAHDDIAGLTGYVADVPTGKGEGNQAELAGRHIGITMKRIGIERPEYLRLWSDAIHFLDSPSYFSSSAALLAVARACRQDGIKVLLTGEGADELFGGYDWHLRPYKHWKLRLWVERYLPMLISPRSRQRARDFPLDEPRTQAGLEQNIRRAMASNANSDFMPKRLLSKLSGPADEADLAFLIGGYKDLVGHLAGLLHRHDHMGMAASIEMRVPFLENGMIDLGMHLPRWAKLHDRQGKWVAKQVALERLPREIVLAKKKGFPMPASYTAGTERLLIGGLLADQFRWSRVTTLNIVESLARQGQLRYLTVGAEIFLRQQLGGETASSVGEQLNAATAASRQNQAPAAVPPAGLAVLPDRG